MKGPLNELEFIEPERYELHEGPFYHFQISRREFVAALGVGIVISVAVPSALGQRAGRGGGGGAGSSLAQRLHIGADGLITVFTSKVEVGQGSRTQLTQAAAEELEINSGTSPSCGSCWKPSFPKRQVSITMRLNTILPPLADASCF